MDRKGGQKGGQRIEHELKGMTKGQRSMQELRSQNTIFPRHSIGSATKKSIKSFVDVEGKESPGSCGDLTNGRGESPSWMLSLAWQPGTKPT